jgi:signal transduction histidine kinase
MAIALIALADWRIGNRASLGLLYILPMMVAATVLPPAATVALAFVCALLRSAFDLPSPGIEVFLRFAFAVVAYTGCGLIVTGLIRNRETALEHLDRVRREQDLRRHFEEQLQVLVESSPAAILTLDATGCVLASNKAAKLLLMLPEGETLVGRSIGPYIPFLMDALRYDPGPAGLRTAAQCQGRRDNGEIFSAHTWFSSYATPHGARLAAIVVDSSEEMRDREEESLRQLLRGNRIAAAAVSHEVRNLCDAIAMVCGNLEARHAIAGDEDFQGLRTLVHGLERIASSQLQPPGQEAIGEVNLRAVLDDLRIVIEPDWREIDGSILWEVPDEIPAVLGERPGLLQAFLNLAQNSHRAVRDAMVRELRIAVSVEERIAVARFCDSGPGIADPAHLFEPFQTGADGTGLGLYVSRSVVRSYGGDLRFEPGLRGTCFRVEMQVV